MPNITGSIWITPRCMPRPPRWRNWRGTRLSLPRLPRLSVNLADKEVGQLKQLLHFRCKLRLKVFLHRLAVSLLRGLLEVAMKQRVSHVRHFAYYLLGSPRQLQQAQGRTTSLLQ